jgi:site-specific DNA recombinase
MKVYAYLRVSTDQQAESGAGLAAQQDACNKWATVHKVQIEQIFTEEGISGALGLDQRPALMGLISVLRKGDVLLVAKWDRVGREELSVAFIEKAVRDRGAKIVSAAGEGTEDSDELSGFLMRKMAKLFAEYERMLIKTRTKSAMQAKKARGERVGHIPFGHQLAEDGEHLERNPEEQAILQQIVELRRNGLSTRQIAAEMNSRGAFNRGQALWNHASMHRVMSRAVLEMAA